MKRSLLPFALIPALAVLPACRADETVGGYGAAERVWRLESIDGAAFSARATLTFPEPGKIAGQAPCNRYFGPMTVPYPWFDAGQVASTRMACPDLTSESKFLKALSEMSLSEVSGDVLLLSNDAGRTMVFKAE
ncbi:META domain-containing protein [Lentibacter algarum]|uniref:META domain-containing protein n=1 Tax=Lentibacter algarum TaxID=576131 RepID=UPI001C095341|nr:META domain-containing protein [Lentibacter algarum]MBU2983005.1 META domain-containing protein [Lentibacter algarum]